MSSRNKVLSILIALSLVLSFIAPISEIAYGTKPSYHDEQTFYLPIGTKEDHPSEEEFGLLSNGVNDYIGQYVFKGDTVLVYMKPETTYPILGRPAIVMKLEATKPETLTDLEYTVVLRDGSNDYVSEKVAITYGYGRYNEDNIWLHAKNILAYFPEDIIPDDYLISLEVKDTSGNWTNNIELEKTNLVEESDEIIKDLEEKVDFVEYLNISESSTNSTFNTGFVPIKLTWLEIASMHPVADEIIIYKENPVININNLGRPGTLEGKIVDDQGKTVYTTNLRTDPNTFNSKSKYTIEYPFGELEDYNIYGGVLNLYKSDETTIGSYKLIVILDGEEIYEKRINIVEEYPSVRGVGLDNYLIHGDREFNIVVFGDYITNKDLLKVQLVTKSGMGIAVVKESQYVDTYDNTSGVMYTMEVLLGEEIVEYGEYYVKLTYEGEGEFKVHATDVKITTSYQTEVWMSHPSPTSDSEIIIEGLNFKAGYKYTADVKIGTEELGNFDVDYISTRQLSLDMGNKLIEGSYNITLYGKMYGDTSDYIYFIGHSSLYFYRETEESTWALQYAYPAAISSSQESFNGEIYIYNFFPEAYEDLDIKLADNDGNIVGEGQIYRYKYDNIGSWTEFKMNITQALEQGYYYYIYKYKDKEIEAYSPQTLAILSTEKAGIEKITIKDSSYDQIITPDKDIEFTLKNGLNIKDISKLDIYINDPYGTRLASLLPNTLIEYEEDEKLNYDGKLNLIDKGTNYETSTIYVIYDEEIIYTGLIILTDKAEISYIVTDNIISSYSDEYNIKLFHPINIDPQELTVEVYDLQGNLVDTRINRYTEFVDLDFMSYGEGIELFIGFNEPLKDAYYDLYIYHKGIDITDEIGFNKGFYASKNPRLIAKSYGTNFENEDMIIGVTDFIETSNIPLGENYTGKFYLKGSEPYEQELIGEVNLVSGKKYGRTGILIPSEEFLDYPVGQYNLIILKSDGDLFGNAKFYINYKEQKIIDPNNPGVKKPSFAINQNAAYTNNKVLSLTINLDGYTSMKIADSMEELANAKIINANTLIYWTLSFLDGEKTVYIQFFDEEGNKSGILSKSIILDTETPRLGEITVSKLDNITIGDTLDITAFGNEKGKAYALFYLKGIEVGKYSLDYAGKTDLYKYAKSIKVNKKIDKIKVYLEDLAGNKSTTKEKNINMLESQTNTLTVIVKDDKGVPQGNKYIYISNYKENFYESSYTDTTGEATFQLPSDLDYVINLYSKGYWDSDTVKLDGDKEKIFTIPVARTITGKATIEIDEVSQPVKNANIIFTGTGQQYYATTDNDGNYTVDVIGNDLLELKATHMLYTTMVQQIDPNNPIQDIRFYNKVRVYGSVKDHSGNPIEGVYIYANDKDNWESTITDSEGNYELKLQSGEYTLSHSLVENHESQYEKITINEAVLQSGAINKDFILKSLDYDNSFKGDGNNVKADATTTQRGKTFNLIVNYKNNGTTNATGTVSVDLPTGISVLGGSSKVSNFTDLGPGESGKIVLAVKVEDSFQGNKIIIPAKISINSENFSIGFAELDIIDVTITAPTLVADGNFKVYGEATSGSTVSIIDRNTNQLISVGKVTGKWYTANIVDLAEGQYQLFAKAELNGNIANSRPVEVTVDPVNGIKVKDIKVTTSGGNEIGMNHEIGVPAFSAWVDMSLKGKDIGIDVDLSKYIGGMTAEFLFADKVSPASYSNGRWKADLTGWSGSGTKKIIMRITIGDLIHEFVVGEVIILIDPSGYVYDINTGDRIQGAKATLEKLNGTVWDFWDAELYGQINPQLTDEEGKYGWMVGEGVYRVTIEKNGYEKAIVGTDGSIVIPPPRDDVNIGLQSILEEYIIMPEKQAPTANHPWTIEFNQDVATNINSNNVYIMDENGNKLSLITPRVDGKKIILDNTGSFTKGKTYTIVIKKTVKSKDGKSLDKGINMKFTVK